MKNAELDQKIRARRKRAFRKSIFVNLALLIPPIVCLQLLVIAALSTYTVSLFLIYFILPMFYTVEKRLRYDISGIGNPDFSYADGYKAFFGGAQGGIFGIILSVLEAFFFGLVFYLAFSNLFPYLCQSYPGAYDVYSKLVTLYSDPKTSQNELITYFTDNGAVLTQPLSIFIGLVLFFPIFLLVFFFLNGNLDDHYLCTIVLPDIDKNISASQARSISRSSFGRAILSYRLGKTFRYNWPFYVLFSLIYGSLVYGGSFLVTDNLYLVPLIVLVAPSVSLFFALILNYFCLANEYAVLEESQNLLLSRLPKPMRESIYRTYCDSHYVHGEESSARGSFVPNTVEERPASPAPAASPAPSSAGGEESKPTGFVIDLSQGETKKDDRKDEKK
jgi:hypothetical protein